MQRQNHNFIKNQSSFFKSNLSTTNFIPYKQILHTHIQKNSTQTNKTKNNQTNQLSMRNINLQTKNIDNIVSYNKIMSTKDLKTHKRTISMNLPTQEIQEYEQMNADKILSKININNSQKYLSKNTNISQRYMIQKSKIQKQNEGDSRDYDNKILNTGAKLKKGENLNYKRKIDLDMSKKSNNLLLYSPQYKYMGVFTKKQQLINNQAKEAKKIGANSFKFQKSIQINNKNQKKNNSNKFFNKSKIQYLKTQISYQNQTYSKIHKNQNIKQQIYNQFQNILSFQITRKIQKKFKISDFVVGKTLGKGKFGQVHIAKHRQIGYLCALKKISKQYIKRQNLQYQLIRQLKIQSFLYNPHIVNLYGFFPDQNFIYIILQYCSGGELYKQLKKKRRLQQKVVANIVKQVCDAVGYLHKNHILHRDIKPQNIILQNGTVKLCDFGWAVSCNNEMRTTLCGTPVYLSPQILKGQQYDYSTDIWSIGILTYELLTGDIPFKIGCEKELKKIIQQKVQFPGWISISDVAKDFIQRILQKNPKQRISIQQLIEHKFIKNAKQIMELL